MSWLTDLVAWWARAFSGAGGQFGGAGATATVERSQEDVNQDAGLAAIRKCEGTDRPIAFRALYGYHPVANPTRLFDGYADHPRKKFAFDGTPLAPGAKPAPYSYTTAAGAFQIVESTFDRVCKLIGKRDFSPESQTEIALHLIRERGALGDLRAGRLEAFVSKCSPVWASLPYAQAGQPKKSIEFVRKAYLEAGGKEDR